MALYAPYAMTWRGVSYTQFQVLPTLTATASAYMRRSGRAVAQAGVTATKAITVSGVDYAAAASLAALTPAQIRRLLRGRRAH